MRQFPKPSASTASEDTPVQEFRCIHSDIQIQMQNDEVYSDSDSDVQIYIYTASDAKIICDSDSDLFHNSTFLLNE